MTIVLSWIMQWPKDSSQCINLDLYLRNGNPFNGCEECTYPVTGGKKCSYIEVNILIFLWREGERVYVPSDWREKVLLYRGKYIDLLVARGEKNVRTL